jgi:hypothetical protein
VARDVRGQARPHQRSIPQVRPSPPQNTEKTSAQGGSQTLAN